MADKTARMAFVMEHPDSPGEWVVWCQAPFGYFMLLAGTWGSRETAEQVIRGFGYDVVDRHKGMEVLADQMDLRPDLYRQQGIPMN